MIEIAARENGVRCIEVGHWTVGGCACDKLQLLLFLAHAKKQKRRQRTVEDMARMCKRGHRDCLRSRASLNQTLRSPNCPVRGNADDGRAVRCCYRGSSPSHLHPTTPSTGASFYPHQRMPRFTPFGFVQILRNCLSSTYHQRHDKHTGRGWQPVSWCVRAKDIRKERRYLSSSPVLSIYRPAFLDVAWLSEVV